MWNRVWQRTLGSHEGREFVVGHVVLDPARVDVVLLLDRVLEDNPVVVVRYDVIIPEGIALYT